MRLQLLSENTQADKHRSIRDTAVRCCVLRVWKPVEGRLLQLQQPTKTARGDRHDTTRPCGSSSVPSPHSCKLHAHRGRNVCKGKAGEGWCYSCGWCSFVSKGMCSCKVEDSEPIHSNFMHIGGETFARARIAAGMLHKPSPTSKPAPAKGA